MRASCIACALALAASGCTKTYCTDECRFAGDGVCDDGRAFSYSGLCEPGTDCADCGPNLDALAPVEAYPGGFGAPEESGSSRPFTPNLGGDCSPQHGYYCSRSHRSWYAIWGTVGSPLCYITVDRSCGENRLCAEDANGRAIGCRWEGAGTVEGGRVVICEPAGECTNGVPVRSCSDWPLVIPIDGTPWYSLHYTTAGARRWACPPTGRERWDHPGAPAGCYDPYPGRVHRECVALGADGYCPPDGGPCTAEVSVEPTPTPVSAQCREQIRTLSGTTSGNSCIDRCVSSFVTCAERDNCATINSCYNTFQICVGRCS